ncbi:hypothetical protein D3P07_11550 [Paenibacillus sp. 1011MAR3C5]|uniref:head-tail connector protein n=1 Tax=Paenibacillus sp. 1011MAR3C5 TaxID=1675787 RepID=UPI000E6D158F|nr:hypothetical protein [Paenibacillus sp. 1011MAR3C5]RJE88621.1 hypothetical protein D3P07_11550 [Paenibacillus sp. 1011MAR3C5]
MLKLKQIIPPDAEPVTNEQVYTQLRYDDDMITPELTNQISDLITAAREWCEGYQNRAYLTQTIEVALDKWPCNNTIQLPRPPLQSFVSLIYSDNGNLITVNPDKYTIDDYSFVPRLISKSWPSSKLPVANGIIVRYVAGWASIAEVPQRIKQAIIILTVHWFENGMCDPPPAVYNLLNLDRVIPI